MRRNSQSRLKQLVRPGLILSNQMLTFRRRLIASDNRDVPWSAGRVAAPRNWPAVEDDGGGGSGQFSAVMRSSARRKGRGLNSARVAITAITPDQHNRAGAATVLHGQAPGGAAGLE